MKKIIAVLLSVAVLFAFAACDNSTTNPYFGKQVQSVTLQSSPDYLVGETVNPADIALRVVYTDNTTATVYGDQVGLKRDGGFTIAEADVKSGASFDFNYGSYNALNKDNAGKPMPWSITVPVYTVEGVKVDVTNAPTTVAEGEKTVKTDNLVFSLVYNTNEEKTGISAKTLKEVYKIEPTATVGEVASDNTAPVTVSVSPSMDVTGDENWVVTVTEADTSYTVSIKHNPEQEIFKVKDATTTESLSTLEFIVTVTYADPEKMPEIYSGTAGSALTAADGGDKSIVVNFSEFAGNKLTTAFEEGVFDPSSVNAYITIDGKYYGVEKLDIDYTDDYPTKVEAMVALDGKTFDVGKPFDIQDFKFVIKETAALGTVTSGDVLKDSEKKANIEIVTWGVDYGTSPGTEDYPVVFKWIGETETTFANTNNTLEVEVTE